MYSTDTTILGESRGSAAAWLAIARSEGAKRLLEVGRYLDEVYQLAPAAGIRAEVAVVQAIHETDWFRSHWWNERLNPAGIGITGDDKQNNASKQFGNGVESARAQLVHLWLYAGGRTLPAALAMYRDSDPRWDAAVSAGYAGKAKTIGSLTNTWAMDSKYGDKLVNHLNAYAADWGEAAAEEVKEGNDMSTHRFIFSAGHRNTDRGGAWKGPESAWTYPICQLAAAEVKRRGGEAWIIQEEDGDSDPTFSVGRGLQNAARLCVDLANTVGGVDAYISMHYGAEPVNGFFAIYPDAHSGVDVAANNPLDIRLAKVFAKHVGKTGMPIRGDGTMSERKSGVGLQGYRLGEFVGTLGFRHKTARIIAEAGNSLSQSEYDLMWSPAWQEKYVSALVDGLEEVFGTFKGGTAPVPEPVPKPTPKPAYAEASPVPALQDERPFLLTDGGAVFVRADVLVEVTKDTPRLKYAGGDAKVGPDVKKGERFATDYLIVNDDGSLYWYTPWATRIRYEDTRVIEEDAS